MPLMEKQSSSKNLSLSSLNHISLLCTSVEESAAFYENVLGFVRIKRPGSFNFDGSWLFKFGVGIHLIEARNPADLPKKKSEINPRDNHISFQCEDMKQVEECLAEMGVDYIKRKVEEGGIIVDQIFFHDPDGFMIEVCNCDNIPVIPLGATATVPVCSYPRPANMAPSSATVASGIATSSATSTATPKGPESYVAIKCALGPESPVVPLPPNILV